MTPALAALAERYRGEIPGMVAEMAQVVVDNPGQLALLGCGSYVLTSVLMNLVRPRGLPGAIATAAVSTALFSLAASEAHRRGMLPFRVRDPEGRLIVLGGPGAAGA